jgi:CheY-like chemotaxis protein/CHASE3 domain sensor protein
MDLSLKRKLIKHYSFGALLFLSILMGTWFLKVNFDQIGKQEERLTNRMNIINQLDNIILSAVNAETGVRGFLLVNRKEFLDVYNYGKDQVWQHYDKAKQFSRPEDSQVENFENLKNKLNDHFLNLKELLDSHNLDSINQSGKKRQVLDGKSTMDLVREQINIIKAFQNQRLAQRNVVVGKNRLYFTLSLFVITVILTLFIMFIFIRIAEASKNEFYESLEKTKLAKENEFTAKIAQKTSGQKNIETASTNVLRYMIETLNLPAGRVFVRIDQRVRLVASVGVHDDDIKIISEIKKLPSLIATALERTQVWQVSDIPNNYWNISSSLGESIPANLCFVPIIFEEETIGVFELASFKEINESDCNKLIKSSEVMGVGFNSVISRENLQLLLEKTQQQSEELQSQQEELRTNNEELEQQARALESQQEALNIKNQELEATKTELVQRAQELTNSNQHKSDFLAKMSHELRTPLNGLLILSTLLIENKENNLTDRQLDFARSINSAGKDLLVLINDILDLSKIEAKKLVMRPESFLLENLFEVKKRNFLPQIEAKGLTYSAELPPKLKSLSIFTDRQRLDQILRNFFSNAIKFTEKGKISLKAELTSEQNKLRLTVSDSGIGIPENKRKLIFNAFEQADSSTSRRFGGTGLGLTISQELAYLLGGNIYVESIEGKGSDFTIEFPINYKEIVHDNSLSLTESAIDKNDNDKIEKLNIKGLHINANANHEAQEQINKIDKNKKSILIVEDDMIFRQSVAEVVTSYGFHPIETNDGEVALAILKEITPDAILLDIRLPGISGLGILEMIKQMPHLRPVPVHMISAFDHQHNALRMGAHGYLTKPVTIEKVRAAIERINYLLDKNVRKVLLIEDDKVQNKAISELISGKDIIVISENNGKDAVERIKNEIFDCIILDIKLPDLDGFEILSKLNSIDVSLPPVIIYTGKDLTQEEEEHLKKYSESIVIKGARSPERLLDEVNLFLHRVESMLPKEKREMLSNLRTQEKVLENKTVLVVDDDIRNIFALTSALENKGMNLIIARDGIEAVEKINSNSLIDLVLMDIMMPKMDGFEAIRKVRSSNNNRLKNLPIVALTAKAMKDDHEKCMEAGASDYLPKPINLDNLMTVLKVWLSPKGIVN